MIADQVSTTKPKRDGILLNISETAELLRVRPSTIRKWLSEGRIAKVKLGRRVLLRRVDVEDFVLKNLIPRDGDGHV